MARVLEAFVGSPFGSGSVNSIKIVSVDTGTRGSDSRKPKDRNTHAEW